MPVQPISLTDNNQFIDRKKIFHEKLNVEIFDTKKEITSYDDVSIEKTIIRYRKSESMVTKSSKRLKLDEDISTASTRSSSRMSDTVVGNEDLEYGKIQHIWSLNMRRLLLEHTFHIPVGTQLIMAVAAI